MRVDLRLALAVLVGSALVACQCEGLPAAPRTATGAAPQAEEPQVEISFTIRPDALRPGSAAPEESPRKKPGRVSEALFEESLEVREYFAKYGGRCGLTLLHVSPTERGPFVEVGDIGAQTPSARLKAHAHNGRFIIQGRFTGRLRRGGYCGYFPEFEVFSFKPWGPVRRCTSIGSPDPSFHVYKEHLPKDRYVPEDFVEGPELPMVDDVRCRRTRKCRRGELLVEGCAGDLWCCPLWYSKASPGAPDGGSEVN